MNVRRVIRMAAAAALATSLLALLPSISAAATLSPTAGANMSSTTIVGEDVYWFQRTTSKRPRFPYPPVPISDSTGMPDFGYYYPNVSVPGRVLHRKLGSRKVSVVYKPTDKMAISGFAARAGRVAVGLTSLDGRLRSSIVELVRSGETWTAKPIVERVGGEVEGRCDSQLKLLNIDSDSRLVYEDVVVEGQGGKCDLIRRKSVIKRTGTDGATEEIEKSQSGWALDAYELPDLSMRAGPGSWFARDSLEGAGVSAHNIETGSTHVAPLMLSSLGRVEVSADGRLLRKGFTTQKRRLYMFSRSAENPQDNVILRRSGHVNWFHLCGSKVLEIARSRSPRKRGGGRFWYLYVRGFDGAVERQIPTKLPRGTAFDGCSADTALFSRTVRKNRVRQIAVRLAG